MSTSSPLPHSLHWEDSFRFTVSEADNCPFYVPGDDFETDGRGLTMTCSKPACLVLTADITAAIVARMLSDNPHSIDPFIFPCGGCVGSVKVTATATTSIYDALSDDQRKRVEGLVDTLGRFSLFKTLKEKELRKILPEMQAGDFLPGAIVIRQGEPGLHLYIVESGTVDILAGENDEILLTTLGQGEIFGEMSLLAGTKISATVKAHTAARILAIEGRQFSRMVSRYPSLQQYLFRLLTHRLRQTNTLKEAPLQSGIKGNLDDMQLAELLQALHTSRKTGQLTLKLSRGIATVVMRDGALIDIDYLRKGADGFFELLKETDGTFSFSPEIPPALANTPPIDDFMKLLMEGFVRIDESEQSAIG